MQTTMKRIGALALVLGAIAVSYAVVVRPGS